MHYAVQMPFLLAVISQWTINQAKSNVNELIKKSIINFQEHNNIYASSTNKQH